jgi:hypothetical protein
MNHLAWSNIGAGQTVLDWIERGVPFLFKHDQPPPVFQLSNPKFSRRQLEFLSKEIQRLENCGFIEKSVQPHCVSPLKCVPKKNGKLRLCINLFQLNKYSVPPKFQYESISAVAQSITFEDHLVTIDLKDGFYHVPIAPNHRKYFGFVFNGEFFQWCVCPFGWNGSPYYFYKLMREVVKFIRSNNIRAVMYVDDLLLMSHSATVTDHKDFIVQTFEDLGLRINFEKSALIPSTTCDYLGYIIDSKGPDHRPWLYISKDKIRKLRKSITHFLQTGLIPARALAKICGVAVAMSKAIIPAKLKLRHLYSLLRTKRMWSDVLSLTVEAREQLHWWLDSLDSWNGAPLTSGPVDFQLWTDSSGFGWGAVLDGEEACGVWPSDIAKEHINFKELLTILYALSCFRDKIRDKHVRIMCDSVTAIYYVRNMGGPIMRLSDLAESVWECALRLNVQIDIHHIGGHLNCHADHLSRLNPQHEWQLQPGTFRQLDRMWGPHTMDRFASMATTLLPRYNSRYLDPLTSGVDALSQTDWQMENNFVNPPFRLLAKVLDIVIQTKAQATIIAPMWPSQPWWPRLQSILVCEPLRIRSPRLSMTNQTIVEPMKNKWKIYAWRVDGAANLPS